MTCPICSSGIEPEKMSMVRVSSINIITGERESKMMLISDDLMRRFNEKLEEMSDSISFSEAFLEEKVNWEEEGF